MMTYCNRKVCLSLLKMVEGKKVRIHFLTLALTFNFFKQLHSIHLQEEDKIPQQSLPSILNQNEVTFPSVSLLKFTYQQQL